MTDRDVTVVVGGGIIGLACAYELALAGRDVHLVDRAPIGSGASGGNAGWVTRSQCLPVPSPGSVRTALKSAGRPDAPLYVRPTLSPRFLRWLWEFRRHCTAGAFAHGTRSLAALAEHSGERFAAWESDGVDTTLGHPGLLHVFLDEREAERTIAIQRDLASDRFPVPEVPMSASEARLLEPALRGDIAAAYLVAGEGLVNPRLLVASLVERLTSMKVTVDQGRTVTGLEVKNGRVRSVRCGDLSVPSAEVVVAAGTWTADLLAATRRRLPLESGKGYSFSVGLPVAPRYPLYLGDKHIAVSPLGATTRIAGTMEFSGNNLRLDWRRVEAIARASRHYLGSWFDRADELIGLVADPWVGGRPMLPDGLPLIDRVPDLDNAYVATGHGMLGVTLAPSTATGLAELITTGRKPAVLAPFGFAGRA